MRVLVLSDLHREIWYHPRAQDRGPVDPCSKIDLAVSRPDLVILAGDIDVGARAVEWADKAFSGLQVLYVHGNHEGYGQNLDEAQKEIAEACAATGHVHYLDRREKVIDGVRFFGATLWTDFKLYGKGASTLSKYEAGQHMNDYKRIRLAKKGYRKLRPDDTERWHFRDRIWIEERLAEPYDGKTVVITHMAPSERSIIDEYKGDSCSPAFASHLDHLVERADLWIHGHVHSSFDYRIGRGRVVCNPLGYPESYENMLPENPAFDPNMVIEI
jgi:DNA repair exonuclease SbcCD nuclease subunit